MAVPGEITSALSAGTNGLLRQGAAPVTCVRDVLESLGLDVVESVAAPADPASAALLDALAAAPRTIDELTALTGLEAGVVAAALTALELDGRVSAGDGTFRSTIAR
jgi:DNA processing protein